MYVVVLCHFDDTNQLTEFVYVSNDCLAMKVFYIQHLIYRALLSGLDKWESRRLTSAQSVTSYIL